MFLSISFLTSSLALVLFELYNVKLRFLYASNNFPTYHSFSTYVQQRTFLDLLIH